MPRNVLSIPSKTSPLSSSAFSRAIRQHIFVNFTDTHPDAFTEDLREIASLRDNVTHMDAHVVHVNAVLKYNAQLVFMGTKFPPDVNISFPWTVAFPQSLSFFHLEIAPSDSPPTSPELSQEQAKPYIQTTGSSQTVAHPDLRYERACLLFCLASLYSSLGAQESRSEGESIKRAIASFSASAGVLQYILDELTPHLAPLWQGGNARFCDADLCPAMLSSLREAMIAQAQECFWQKAVVDRLKDATIAKLAMRVSELYSSALEFAGTGGSLRNAESSPSQGCELPKEWINHMTIKKWHFAAAAQYRKSVDDLSANRYGDEIGRLKVAETAIKRAFDAPRTGISEALLADLKSLQGVIASSLKRAMKDNDLIYLESVTATNKLPMITSASMVTAKIPGEVSNPIPYLREKPEPAFGRPLFQELVPYGVHVAISIFDERKDSFVRDDIELKKDELDSLATSTLQSLNLPGSLQALEQPEGLPPVLLRKSEEIRSEGGLERLQALSHDVQKVAKMCRDMWHETSSQVRASPSSSNPMVQAHIEERNHTQGQAFAEQVEEYGQTIHEASQSDELVQRKVQEWSHTIGVLAGGAETLARYIPGTKDKTSTTGGQGAAVRALRAELEALDDLIDCRTSICEEARAIARKHDVRPSVMREAGIIASGGSTGAVAPLVIEAAHFEPLFEEEMKLYDKMRREMDASEEEQRRLLDVIVQRNNDFIGARKVDSDVLQREKSLQKLDLAYSRYREISSNLVEGLRFYNALIQMLTDLRDSIRSWRQQTQVEMNELAMRMEQSTIESKQSTPSKSLPSHSTQQPLPSTRRTRSKAREEEQTSHSPSQPWGPWQGGEIRFGD